MRKRKSAKKANQDFNYVFADLKEKPITTSTSKPWLTMTPEQIDTAYWQLGKADRARMKREATQEAQRLAVQEILRQEKSN
jgi:hypothetical protein